MRAGRLRVLVHRASCSDLPKDNLDFFCAVEACNYGKLYTESKCADDLHWDEELTFHIGPDATDDSGPGAKLSVCLYAAPPDSDDKQLLGMGSMRIEGIEEGDGKREIVLPLVNHLGKHSGEVHLSARFFSSRTPGKSRDELGREVIDHVLVCKGPRDAPREMNQRSPKHSPRRPSSREREFQPEHVHNQSHLNPFREGQVGTV